DKRDAKRGDPLEQGGEKACAVHAEAVAAGGAAAIFRPQAGDARGAFDAQKNTDRVPEGTGPGFRAKPREDALPDRLDDEARAQGARAVEPLEEGDAMARHGEGEGGGQSADPGAEHGDGVKGRPRNGASLRHSSS